jgi:hypothetical protein
MIILLAIGCLLPAIPARAVDGPQLLAQIDRNLNPESYEMYRKLINVEPDGSKKEYTLFTVKKGSDKKKKLPTKIECLTEAGLLIKTLYFKDVKDLGGGIVRPAVIETDSPLYKGYKSIMVFAKIKKRDFKDEVFTMTFMPNIDSLR